MPSRTIVTPRAAIVRSPRTIFTRSVSPVTVGAALALSLGCDVPQTLGAWPDAARDAPDAARADAPELVRTYAAVAVGSLRSCALSEGRAFCWGDPADGALGPGASGTEVRPRAVVGVRDASALGLGDRHACALAAGRVVCWGDGAMGQLGEGRAAGADPAEVPGTAGADALAVGRLAACARVAGSWRCWGALPGPGGVSAALPRFEGAAVVGVGFGHACAGWREAGGLRVRCAGDSYEGQLGDAVTTPRTAAVDFLDERGAPVVDAQALAVGTAGTCVTRGDRRAVYCRGEIARGARGGVSWALPEPVADVSVGVGYVCAVTESGAAWCWGNGTAGQLGDGSRGVSDAPVRAAPESGVAFAEVRAGAGHTCARSVDGQELWCWGSNRDGQLGAGNTDSVAGAARVLPP